jgi:hypothetical protein
LKILKAILEIFKMHTLLDGFRLKKAENLATKVAASKAKEAPNYSVEQ